MVPGPPGVAQPASSANVVAAASAFSVAARTAREGDGREQKNSCMMIDLCTDLQKTKPRLWRGLKEFQRCRMVMRHRSARRD